MDAIMMVARVAVLIIAEVVSGEGVVGVHVEGVVMTSGGGRHYVRKSA
jgi:hypothetical protein